MKTLDKKNDTPRRSGKDRFIDALGLYGGCMIGGSILGFAWGDTGSIIGSVVGLVIAILSSRSEFRR